MCPATKAPSMLARTGCARQAIDIDACRAGFFQYAGDGFSGGAGSQNVIDQGHVATCYGERIAQLKCLAQVAFTLSGTQLLLCRRVLRTLQQVLGHW